MQRNAAARSVQLSSKRRQGFGFAPRARSLGKGRLTPDELAEKARIDADPALLEALAARPRDRSECRDGPRPCPYVSCRHHLAIDITERGAVRRRFPHLEVWEMPETCSLDVADRGGITQPELGRLALNASGQAGEQEERLACHSAEIAVLRIRRRG